jgi:hypothetical protein
VLPVPCFHLVFTLPHDLNGLIAAAPRPLYETLFVAVSATLTEFAASPRHLGGVSAFSLVLHTWKQDLGRHVHLHALVAGGALAANGEWISPKKGFLFPVSALSCVFRGQFVTGLKALRSANRLPGLIATPADWQRLRQRLYVHDGVVYAKQPLGGPEAVPPSGHNVNLRSCGGLRDDRSRFRSSAAVGRRRHPRSRSASQ